MMLLMWLKICLKVNNMTWKDTLLKEEKKTMMDFIDLVEKSRVRFEKEMKEQET